MFLARRFQLALTVMAILIGSPANCIAQVLLTTEHVDIDLGFTPPVGTPGGSNLGTWDISLADETNGVGYATSGAPGATNWAQLFVGTNALTPRSSNPVFSFLGIPAGQNYYHLSQTQTPGRLFVGVGGEDNDPGATNAPITYRNTDPRVNQPTGTDPDANLAPWIRLRLVSMNGPAGGHFSIWTGDNSNVSQSNVPADQIWIATSDGISVQDSLFVINGSHLHFNFGFTEPGAYHLFFEASAFLGGTASNPQILAASDPTVVTFIVQPIPEPSSIALVSCGAIGIIVRIRRAARAAD